MFKRQTLTRAGLGVLGAAVLAMGGAGFLTASNAADNSPACPQGTAAAAANTQAGGSGSGSSGGASGSVSAGATAPSPASGSGSGLASGLQDTLPAVPSDPTGALPTTGDPTDALAKFLAAVNQALASTPVGTIVPQATGATNGGLFVGASSSSSRTGATVTPDSSGTGSHVGLVGIPGTSGTITNFGL